MVRPTMNAEKPSLAIALKTLWGAAEMPFGEACAEPFRHPGFEELTRRLEQLCQIGASGVLHGPNGIGKSYLCGCFTDKLPEKRYKILSLAHSSLTGSDLIRALCRQLGVPPQMRRSDNVANIHAAFGQLGSRWPLLVLEEAQNFSASALEEVRLLTCARSDTRPPFSLLLIGEDSLLPRLQMGINHALISRLGFALALTRLEPAQSREYVSARLRAVGVHSNPFEDQGLELLIQAASGLPRAINHLAQRAIEAAAADATPTISAIHVQAALDRLPWLGSGVLLRQNHRSFMDTNTLAILRATHELYCQLTGQKLSLRFDRERLWYEFLRAGFSAQDLKSVVAYLQKEIRASRRNVGALKLSNLLQLDRFEEDLNISNVRLRSAPPPQSPRSTPTDPSPPTPAQLQNLRQEAKAAFARLRQELGKTPDP